ncbi:aryl-alcohol dehydrogenase-like predicted oxidoreductase [Labedella gwakjiensis]|uniref:Aldo/keto reductase n=1 Tax=Labedella gwakjiensis TaxID=390269 RepID=A0A2P8GYK7_9MICO|nr:aldo/keto reductase [Labedella gwakjiensis]PSL39031.1 aryl-alcohol dehydrogenase-like predicted oxidoreductase [Labedella gwakjiensis]RUQ86518.1 aldo/keto reductase [Labedella gwakjiensis]
MVDIGQFAPRLHSGPGFLPSSANPDGATPSGGIPSRDVEASLAAGAHPSAPIGVMPGIPGIGERLRRPFGDTDLRVFPVGLGGSVFGWTASADETRGILDRYADYGGNFIDTADSYAGGLSEVRIGAWMAHRGNRDRMVVSTKIGRHPDAPGLGPVNMVRAVEASLERLQTDHIDLLFFHTDDETVPLEDSLGTAAWLIESGKVRYLAASNFTPARIVEARILASTGLPRFVGLQHEYSLLSRRGFEGDSELVARGQRLGVLAYYALGNGFLTGKYRSRADFVGGGSRAARASAHFGRRGLRILSVLDHVAAEHNTSPTSIALAWLLAKQTVTAPVVSASRPDQVDDLVAATGVQLTRTQMVELDRVSS